MRKGLIVQLQSYKKWRKQKKKTKYFSQKRYFFVEIGHTKDIFISKWQFTIIKWRPYNCYLPFSEPVATIHLLLFRSSLIQPSYLIPTTYISQHRLFPLRSHIWSISIRSVLFACLLFANLLSLCYLFNRIYNQYSYILAYYNYIIRY